MIRELTACSLCNDIPIATVCDKPLYFTHNKSGGAAEGAWVLVTGSNGGYTELAWILIAKSNSGCTVEVGTAG